MPHLPDTSTARTEPTMDQLRIPALAIKRIDRLRSEAERDRCRQVIERDPRQATAGRAGWRLRVRRASRQQHEAEPC